MWTFPGFSLVNKLCKLADMQSTFME